MDKITILVSVYNRLESLKNLLKCLIIQTSEIEELIICDDGSNQKIEGFIDKLIPKCNFKIKHVYQNDKGFRKTKILNEGSKQSEGNYLVFLDQDVIFGKTFIKEIKENCRKNYFQLSHPLFLTKQESIDSLLELKKNILYTKDTKIMTKINKARLKELYKRDRIRNFYKKIFIKKRGAKMAGLFFSLYKEDYIRINGFDEKYQGWGYEDDDICNRFYASGMKSIPLEFKEPLFHIWHEESKSKKMSLNEEYYRKRKKEISRKNYKSKFGLDNSFDKEKVIIKRLK